MKHGDPNITLNPVGKPAPERFWAKVDKTAGCWLWTGSRTDKGYGQFRPVGSGPMVAAHRWSYEEAYGPIPDGLTVDHVAANGCASKSCVRPSHLEAVTNRENILRGNNMAARHARKDHCDNGHEFTEENTRYSKVKRVCKTCERVYKQRWKAKRAS